MNNFWILLYLLWASHRFWICYFLLDLIFITNTIHYKSRIFVVTDWVNRNSRVGNVYSKVIYRHPCWELAIFHQNPNFVEIGVWRICKLLWKKETERERQTFSMRPHEFMLCLSILLSSNEFIQNATIFKYCLTWINLYYLLLLYGLCLLFAKNRYLF